MSFKSPGYSPHRGWNIHFGDPGKHVCAAGPTWSQTVVPGGTFNAITWDPTTNLYSAVAGPNPTTTGYTSPDGVTWTGRGVVPGVGVNSGAASTILVAGGGYVLTGSDGSDSAYSSNGGVTWVNSISSFPGTAWNLGGAVWDAAHNQFVILTGGAHGGSQMTFVPSTNTWGHTGGAMPDGTNDWQLLAVGGGYLVALATTGASAYSNDGGNTWTAGGALPGFLVGNMASMAFGNGIFVVMPNAFTSVGAYSTNHGVTWIAFNLTNAANYYSIIYAQGVFLTVGVSPGPATYVLTSTDGHTWVSSTNALPYPAATAFWLLANNGSTKYAAVNSATGNTIGAAGSC